MELLECKHLYREFDNKPILKDINLKIPRGKIIGLLGKNGMGKTTLIKIINDLLTPSSGEILINGEKPGIKSKEIIFNLLKEKKAKKVINIGNYGLIGSLLKDVLFYDLGFKIKTEKYFEKYQKDYIVILNENIENENLTLIGEIVDDKIIFDNYSYDKNEIKKIFNSKF